MQTQVCIWKKPRSSPASFTVTDDKEQNLRSQCKYVQMQGSWREFREEYFDPWKMEVSGFA
jgi:hypothetical protein